MQFIILVLLFVLFYLLVTKNNKERFSKCSKNLCVKPWLSKNPTKCNCKSCYNPYKNDVEYIFSDDKITKIQNNTCYSSSCSNSQLNPLF
jgi:hypothetical protein